MQKNKSDHSVFYKKSQAGIFIIIFFLSIKSNIILITKEPRSTQVVNKRD